MKYSRKLNINYGYVNHSLELRNLNILDLFQNLVFDYSLKIGDGTLNSDYRWFVVGYHVIIQNRPIIEEKDTISTWSSNMKGFIASREFEIKKDGKICVKALANLTRYNIKENHLVRLDKQIIDKYEKNKGKGTFENFIVEKISVPESYDFEVKFVPPHCYIDANNHVNNSYYYEIANSIIIEKLGTNFEFKEFIINYKEQIKEHEITMCRVKEYKDCYVVCITDLDGKIIKALIKLFK